ncbi:hypothetical protein PVAP13_5NG392524 [Panicum virgatum]|uniref:Uncharacterized protein n=1 Tax=Panicum virgatum TaxID=38727 RepID=A0A8T0RW86_PANVG|nr:hypothetical protein PVAP13_5NG392524 [Panicum virgatum]
MAIAHISQAIFLRLLSSVILFQVNWILHGT